MVPQHRPRRSPTGATAHRADGRSAQRRDALELREAWINKIEAPGLKATSNEVAIESHGAGARGLDFELESGARAIRATPCATRPRVYYRAADAPRAPVRCAWTSPASSAWPSAARSTAGAGRASASSRPASADFIGGGFLAYAVGLLRQWRQPGWIVRVANLDAAGGAQPAARPRRCRRSAGAAHACKLRRRVGRCVEPGVGTRNGCQRDERAERKHAAVRNGQRRGRLRARTTGAHRAARVAPASTVCWRWWKVPRGACIGRIPSPGTHCRPIARCSCSIHRKRCAFHAWPIH